VVVIMLLLTAKNQHNRNAIRAAQKGRGGNSAEVRCCWWCWWCSWCW